ncbi:MAG: type II toxin-antitoxin system VapC family toxin [Thermoanaerobaculia bacterium]
MALICDTGPIFAALDAADPDHEACARLLLDADTDLVVPTLVLAEVDYWCHERLTVEAWHLFLDDVLAGVYRLEPLTSGDLERCRTLQGRYEDLKLGVVDASVVALAERLGETTIATLDHRHFGVVRPLHTHAFTLLP